MRITFLCVALLAVPLACAARARADEVSAAARERFLADRDVRRLLETGAGRGVPAPAGWRGLAQLAAGSPPPPPPEGSVETRGLVHVVAALRAGDLQAAQRGIGGVGRAGGRAGAWVDALVRLRRGDDAGAIGRLLARPFFQWESDAFGLALLGAALPAEDRWMLAAGGLAALERAAARRRTAAVVATARALAALDPEVGRRAHGFALEALRRAGEVASAEALLAKAPRAGVSAQDPLLALQAALLAWEQGRLDALTALLATAPPPGSQAVYLALRAAGRRGRTLDTGRPGGHATGPRAHAAVLARLASVTGAPVSPAEVERWCRENGRVPSQAGVARAFLEARGMHVVSLLGDPDAGTALLEAGIPFLLYRLLREDGETVDAPALVKGYDRRTALWLLDEPNRWRPDVAPATVAGKARILCAVAESQRGLLAPYEATTAARRGRVVEATLDALARGDLRGALARLGPDTAGGDAAFDLYRGFVLYRVASAGGGEAHLAQAREALERSRRTPPLLAFEERVRGEALLAAGDAAAALGAYDRMAYLEGQSASLALLRFGAERSRENLAAALAALDQAARLAPLDIRVLYYRGTLRVAAGDLAAGRRDLRRALDRRPQSVQTAVALAGVELRAGHPPEALAVLDEAARHDRNLDSDPVLRAARRQAELALIEKARTVEELRGVMRSPEATTRRQLAFALADRAAEGTAAEIMLRQLLGDEDVDVRMSALRLYVRPWLRARVEEDAVLARRITGLLEKDPDANVRAAAAALLGRVRSPLSCRALSSAVGGAQRDADAAVRGAAARALAGHAVGACRLALVDALEDVEAAVRRAAIDTLFQLTGTTRGFEPEAEPAARARAVAAWRAWLAE